jgi:hypothetical protein
VLTVTLVLYLLTSIWQSLSSLYILWEVSFQRLQVANLYGCALVSVVIPTHKRPQGVVSAVESALRQSYAQLEVIVVIDGPDVETMRALLNVHDGRLRVIMLDENVGGSEARNIGVQAARGEWVAFLDDDDEWVSEKLKKQMERAVVLHAEYPILSSRLLARGLDREQVLPQRLYTTGENVAEYLFCRQGFAYGEGMLQTSTLLTKRKLLLDVPFQKGLQRHQDWDWLLRTSGCCDVEIRMIPEVLTLMHVEGQGESVSRANDWSASFKWVKMARPRMTAKAYSFFITTECVPRAHRCQAGVGTIFRLLWECLWRGRPGFRQMVLFLSFFVVPDEIRRELRSRKMRPIATLERKECSQP